MSRNRALTDTWRVGILTNLTAILAVFLLLTTNVALSPASGSDELEPFRGDAPSVPAVITDHRDACVGSDMRPPILHVDPIPPEACPSPMALHDATAKDGRVMASTGPAEAAGDWVITPSPNTQEAQTTNFLWGITCVSETDCWTVGYYDTGSVFQTLIERWDGISWSVVSSPNTSATRNNILTGVACVSASDCWAVGSYSSGTVNQTLIQRWDGTSWSVVPSPNTSATQYNSLTGVTCVSASDCWAVGFSSPSIYKTLIQRWDGTLWAIVPSPNGMQDSFLTDVTCVSASDCRAVGYSYQTANKAQTLIQRWDGSAWAIVVSANTLPAQDNFLTGISCLSASDCWAVGYYNAGNFYQTLIERWDGTSWTLVLSPNSSPTQHNFLYGGVTCVSASSCWAVGYYIGGTAQTMIQRWNGSSWVIVSSPTTSPTQAAILYGVACASSSRCWTVGVHNGSIAQQTLIQRWDGTAWAMVAAPDRRAAESTNYLYGVTCVSASDCWAVGYHAAADAYQTLIQRWNGTSWGIVPSPSSSATENSFLSGITCMSASDCWAVGFSTSGSAQQTLIERWDGNSWAIVASPSTGETADNVLYGVACVSASDCWAVGYQEGTASQTLIERWDGTSWAIVASPNTLPVQANILSGVTCVSASDCWAVGYYNAGLAQQTLIERWNGNSWSIVSSPNTQSVVTTPTPSAAQHNFLGGVTCVSPSDCWAVGYSYVGRFAQTLVERWNGTSWAIVPSASTSASQHNVLTALTCVSASDCQAVGYYAVGGVYQTLAERWDGTSWTIQTSASTNSAQPNFLYGVACTSASECWAAGYYYKTGVLAQTLTLRSS